jgi:hypothetical protein
MPRYLILRQNKITEIIKRKEKRQSRGTYLAPWARPTYL